MVARRFYAIAASIIFAVMAVITRAKIQLIEPSRVNALRLWLSLLTWFVCTENGPHSSNGR